MAEETVTIPVPTDAVVEAVLQTQQPTTAVAETDEDYKWLTDRLDALSAENATLRQIVEKQHESLTEALRVNQQQAQDTQRQQTEMIQTLLQSLTALSATALESSKLIPTNSTVSSQETPPEVEETVTETVTEVAPANVEPTPVAPAVKKRLRI